MGRLGGRLTSHQDTPWKINDWNMSKNGGERFRSFSFPNRWGFQPFIFRGVEETSASFCGSDAVGNSKGWIDWRIGSGEANLPGKLACEHCEWYLKAWRCLNSYHTIEKENHTSKRFKLGKFPYQKDKPPMIKKIDLDLQIAGLACNNT